MDRYDDIELTIEEEYEALRLARKKKHFDKVKEDYRIQISKEIEYPSYSPEQYAQVYSKTMKIDGDNAEVVATLCQYFARDEKFNERKMVDGRPCSLDKGIMLFGDTGVGKTEAMEIFKMNQHQSFVLVPCRQIESLYARGGEDGDPRNGTTGIRKYFNSQKATAVNADIFGHQELGFCFDDLGTENATSKYYGSDKSVMAEVIMSRYDNGLPFNMTHITTNLTAYDIQVRYGDRAADRMLEMFNVIAFPKFAKSRRV